VQLRQVFDGARAAAALVRRFLEEDAKDVWRAQEDVWKNKEAGRSEDGKSSLGESQQVEKKINEETKERSDLSETIKLNEDLEPPPGVDINVFRTKKVSQILSKENKGGRATPNTPISAASDEQQTRSSQHPMESLLGKNQSSIDADAQLKATQDSVPSEKVDAKDHHFQMRESRVPSTRFGRLWQYGGLATSMAFGAVGESLRRATGSSTGGSLVLGPRNMERLVAKLSRMRGAALKLGQMISFQGWNSLH
jgi:aarF domain-containing kinase